MWRGLPERSYGICGGSTSLTRSQSTGSDLMRCSLSPTTSHWYSSLANQLEFRKQEGSLTQPLQVSLTEYNAGGKGWKGDSEGQSDVQPTGDAADI